MTEIMLSTGEDDRTIDVPHQETLRIGVPETPSTGYQWRLVLPPASGLELLEPSFKLSPGTHVGGRGVRTFELRAKTPGTTKVQLELRRPLDTSNPPANKLQLTINVI